MELLLCLPPVKGRMRRSVGKIWGAISLFTTLGALVILRTGWPENVLLIPGMLLYFALYRRLIQADNLQALFVFLMSAAIMGFCAVFTDVLLARREIASLESSSTWLECVSKRIKSSNH